MSSDREPPSPARPEDPAATAALIMHEFSSDTGLSSAFPHRRYLWTDAFAVCNCLTLHRRTGEQLWLTRALELVDQVHHVLGRHRPDDSRSGWLSGLGDHEGELRPTAGGLRIGKPLPERRAGEPADPRLEWEQDGQYYHYLTRWMHALTRVSAATGDPRYRSQAVELARVAQRVFVRRSPTAGTRMVWKMSVDLSRSLVDAMGHHDPLDGLITLATLRQDASDLEAELGELLEMCAGRSWTTDDPLGVGGLLVDCYRVAQVGPRRGLPTSLLTRLLADASAGLEACLQTPSIALPPSRRLAFRELGLAIGIAAVQKLADEAGGLRSSWGDAFPAAQAQQLRRFAPLREEIQHTWLDPGAQEARTWTEHLDINRVMLATSLVPDEYLRVG